MPVTDTATDAVQMPDAQFPPTRQDVAESSEHVSSVTQTTPTEPLGVTTLTPGSGADMGRASRARRRNAPRADRRGRRQDAGEVLLGARKFEFTGLHERISDLMKGGDLSLGDVVNVSEDGDEQNRGVLQLREIIQECYGEHNWERLDVTYQAMLETFKSVSQYGETAVIYRDIPTVSLEDIWGVSKTAYLAHGRSILKTPQAVEVFEMVTKTIPWKISDYLNFIPSNHYQTGRPEVASGYSSVLTGGSIPAWIAMPLIVLGHVQVIDEAVEQGKDPVLHGGKFIKTFRGLKGHKGQAGRYLADVHRAHIDFEQQVTKGEQLLDRVALVLGQAWKEPLYNEIGLAFDTSWNKPYRKRYYGTPPTARDMSNRKAFVPLEGAAAKKAIQEDLDESWDAYVDITVSMITKSVVNAETASRTEDTAKHGLGQHQVSPVTPAQQLRQHVLAIVDEVAEKQIKPVRPRKVHQGSRIENGIESNIEDYLISEDDLLKKYGLRGIQYGNWVTQEERAHALARLNAAFGDLAKALNIPEEMIGLPIGKRLGIAIGARGRGKAMAHYERDGHIINLTKLSGSGTLAHEYFHAVDAFLASNHSGIGANYASDKTASSVSTWLTRLRTLSTIETWTSDERMDEIKRILYSPEVVENLTLLASMSMPRDNKHDCALVSPARMAVEIWPDYQRSGDAIKDRRAFLYLLSFPSGVIRTFNPERRVATKKTVENILTAVIEAVEDDANLQKGLLGAEPHAPTREEREDYYAHEDQFAERMRENQTSWIGLSTVRDVMIDEPGARRIVNRLRGAVRMPTMKDRSKSKTEQSRFVRAAIAHDHWEPPSKTNHDKGYWTRPTEMFARAASSVIHEKLASMGIENQLLTSASAVEYAEIEERLFDGLTIAERRAEREAFEEGVLAVMQQRIASLMEILHSLDVDEAESPTAQVDRFEVK